MIYFRAIWDSERIAAAQRIASKANGMKTLASSVPSRCTGCRLSLPAITPFRRSRKNCFCSSLFGHCYLTKKNEIQMKSGQKWQATFFAVRPDMSDTRAIGARTIGHVCDSASVCDSHTISSVHAIVTCGDMNEYIRSICIHHASSYSFFFLSSFINIHISIWHICVRMKYTHRAQ